MKQTVKLGLTGGIGSGKSTVAALLAEQGAGVIDADAISRATTAPCGSAIPLIRIQFGDVFVTPDGALDRERMRSHVFNDPKAKKQLEAIIHPLVLEAISEQTTLLVQSGKPCIVYDIPLLVESGHWRKSLAKVLVVDCDPQTQVQRVANRNALPSTEILKIIAAQTPRLNRLAAADIVLLNDAISLQELAAQVHEIGMQFGL